MTDYISEQLKPIRRKHIETFDINKVPQKRFDGFKKRYGLDSFSLGELIEYVENNALALLLSTDVKKQGYEEKFALELLQQVLPNIQRLGKSGKTARSFLSGKVVPYINGENNLIKTIDFICEHNKKKH